MSNQKQLDVLDIGEKKRLGAYYTPSALSDVLADWAIRSASEMVLEPSFGGCGFLKSAADRLQDLGARTWNAHLYGCDIDKRAFEFLSKTFGGLVDLSHFSHCDFLSFSGAKGWPGSFDVVLGNPPYVPYQNIPATDRAVAIERLRDAGIKLDLRSSLWAYFVALGLTYLSVNGRIAWVLPGSLIQANYAKGLRELINSSFTRTHCFLIKERLFLYEGTDEQTVVLLADDYHKPEEISGADIALTTVKDVSELQSKIEDWDEGRLKSEIIQKGSASHGLLQQESSFSVLMKSTSCKRLGDYVNVRIGLVTGDNRYFVLSPDEARARNLHLNSLRPVVAKFSSARGVLFDDEDHRIDKTENRRCLLVHANDRPAPSDGVERYLADYPQEKIETVSTYRKRKNWFETDDKRPPDAFLPVMCHLGPRLVLNAAQINCTNTLYRVYFKTKNSSTERKLLCISIMSTFSQISAELEGRQYGSGVLKHEPREAEQIRVLMPNISDWRSVDRTFKEINTLVRQGELEVARLAADDFLYYQIGDVKKIDPVQLRGKLRDLREHRHAERSIDRASRTTGHSKFRKGL